MLFQSQCLANSVTWIYEVDLTDEEEEGPRLYFRDKAGQETDNFCFISITL